MSVHECLSERFVDIASSEQHRCVVCEFSRKRCPPRSESLLHDSGIPVAVSILQFLSSTITVTRSSAKLRSPKHFPTLVRTRPRRDKCANAVPCADIAERVSKFSVFWTRFKIAASRSGVRVLKNGVLVKFGGAMNRQRLLIYQLARQCWQSLGGG